MCGVSGLTAHKRVKDPASIRDLVFRISIASTGKPVETPLLSSKKSIIISILLMKWCVVGSLWQGFLYSHVPTHGP